MQLHQHATKYHQRDTAYRATEEESIFNTFPKSWRTDYMSFAHEIHKATLLQVKTYMVLKKLDMDKAYKKKKHRKE